MITLQPIDESNFLDAFRLELEPGQERFVSGPIRSLAQAYVYRSQCTPFGVYAGGEQVGYLLVLYDPEEQTYNLWHMQLDRRFQGRGYARPAILAALDYMKTRPFGPSDRVLLTCAPENTRAWGLYTRLGFAPTGRDDADERELALELGEG